MQRSFIHILSIGPLWDSGSFFKIHPMPAAQNISAVQEPTSVQSSISDCWLSNMKLENVFGRYSTLCLYLKPKLTSDLLGEGKAAVPQPWEVFIWSMIASCFLWIITYFSLMLVSSLPGVHHFSNTMMFFVLHTLDQTETSDASLHRMQADQKLV